MYVIYFMIALIGLHFLSEKDLKIQSHSTLLQCKCSSVRCVSWIKNDKPTEHSQNIHLSMSHGVEKKEVSVYCYKTPISMAWSEHSFSSNYLRWPSRLGLPNNKVKVN